MIASLYVTISDFSVNATAVTVIGDNITNVNTKAFKSNGSHFVNSLRNIGVDKEGAVTAINNNSEMTPLIEVMLVNFPSCDGLTKMGAIFARSRSIRARRLQVKPGLEDSGV